MSSRANIYLVSIFKYYQLIIIVLDVKKVTWTFDYTSILTIGSLFVLLAGALIYYFGMLVCDRASLEYGKIGLVRKYDKVKYYKFGASFLEECIALTFLLGIGILIFVGMCYSTMMIYFPINISDIINSDSKLIQLFTVFNFIFLILQLHVFSWSNQQLKKHDSKNVKYSQAFHKKCLLMSSIPIFSLIVVCIFIVNIIYALFTSESISLHLIYLLLIIIFICVIIPILLAFLVMTNLAYLHGYFSSCRDLSKFKPVDRFIVFLIDGNKIEGQKLRYMNGIYTLSESATSDNKNIDYTIYEDKVHHIIRIYNNGNSEE